MGRTEVSETDRMLEKFKFGGCVMTGKRWVAVLGLCVV